MIVKIVGVKKSESKGREVFNYAGIKLYTQYEQENASCEGNDVVSEFSYLDFSLHPGDVVEFLYEPGFQGRATLTGVRSVASSDNPFDVKAEKK